MNPKIFITVVVLAVIAGGYGAYALGVSRGKHMAAPATSTEPAAAKAGGDPAPGKKVLYWHDPMVPGQKFDKPGKSPFMDMQLVPVYADAGGDESKVTISPRVQQNLGVRTAEVTRGSLASNIEAVGSVAYNERDVAVVQARANGYVERLYARAPLDPVKKGQPLAEIYAPDWVAAQEEYLTVKRMAATSESVAPLLEGALQRMRLVGMTEDHIRAITSTGKLHPRLTVTAPVGGVIAELSAREGMTVTSGAPLFRINGLGTVWVNAEVSEAQAGMVRPGNVVEARTPALPDEVFRGRVSAILPEVNATTRTLKARVEINNPGNRLLPGMFARVTFAPAAARQTLLAPSEAVIQTGRRTVVIVARDGGFAPVDVEIGAEANGQTEIRKGLVEGDKVVVSGQFLIDSEASLRGSATRMSDMPAAGAGQPAAGTPKSAAATHRGEAKVEKIDKDELTLSHGPIPSLQWPPMTMAFKLPAGKAPKGLRTGQAVTFEFLQKNGEYEITSIAPKEGDEMIANLIRWSIVNRFLVLLVTVMVAAWGAWATLKTPLDAIPDLSDVQVIIRTTYAGQAPQIVENQVTYPLATTMLSVPGARTVRGYSMFGDSFVYVIFEDGTDQYWARSRVLEYLSQVQSRLPAQAKTSLGPDATGVGWVYEYALIDRTGRMDLSQLRALQDWFLKYELKAVPNVSEVASVGGMVRQYQIVLDPDLMRAYNVTHMKVTEAVRRANQETGGSVVELAEAEYMVRASGYLQSLDDFRKIPLSTSEAGVPVRLGDVARIQIGPEMRRGIAELNGEGEVAGGIIVMRAGKNALETIDAVKAKLEALKPGLPAGVEIIPTYDRSSLIKRAVGNLREKLIEEFLVVALVCFAFLFHLRSALVAIVSLPLGVLMAFIVMHYQGVNANIMSLGGIAIAIGAMVDAAVVMIENAHKHIEAWHHDHPGHALTRETHWRLITEAATQVGPALFFSLLIITLSFVPVFTLEAQEGRLFSPLAYTKTYAMAAAAGLAVTLIPVLMGYLIRGRIPEERKNPINRGLIRVYEPLVRKVLAFPVTTLLIALVVLVVSIYPAMHIGGEFMPPLDEGDLLYMPSALPGISAGKAAELLQQTNRLIKSIPEVATVFGKAGRADTATDPAPLEMFETTIQFKPMAEWRAGMTPEKLVEELDRVVKVPGLTNIWVPPIRNRIDMLATGIKSPVGVKVAGMDLAEIDRIAADVQRVVKDVRGVTSAFAERLTGGRYIDVKIDRDRASRYGMNVSDVQSIVAAAIGGDNIGETVEGLQRFPINVRYPREIRDSVEKIRNLSVLTERGAQLRLGDVAAISISDGPPMLKSENARLSGWVYIDLHGRDLSSAVRDMQEAVAKQVKLPPGYSLAWSGQFEFLERATARLKVVVPATLLIIFVLLYLTFSRADEALLIMMTLPFALIGGLWLMYLLGYNMSVASAVGFIALGGLAAEFGVVMLIYLRQSIDRHSAAGEPLDAAELRTAIDEGAVQRVRPKAMTVAVILAGLAPIMWSDGTGSETMQRIAAPMFGGMITAPLISMFVIPAAYLLLRQRRSRRSRSSGIEPVVALKGETP